MYATYLKAFQMQLNVFYLFIYIYIRYENPLEDKNIHFIFHYNAMLKYFHFINLFKDNIFLRMYVNFTDIICIIIILLKNRHAVGCHLKRVNYRHCHKGVQHKIQDIKFC